MLQGTGHPAEIQEFYSRFSAGCLNLFLVAKSVRLVIFNRWFDNLYSFLHPAKHGFLFILKNVLFKDINDTEIPITFSKKMI